jgi:CheY-like chemotaxis protein
MAKILVVDDDEIILLLARTSLLRLGHAPCVFASSSEAFAAYAAAPRDFQLVICDVNLGTASGLELARAMLEADADARILMVSGAVGDGDAQRAKAMGVLEVLPKPAVMTDLAGTLARFLPR